MENFKERSIKRIPLRKRSGCIILNDSSKKEDEYMGLSFIRDFNLTFF